jgi:hypothetical protein
MKYDDTVTTGAMDEVAYKKIRKILKTRCNTHHSKMCLLYSLVGQEVMDMVATPDFSEDDKQAYKLIHQGFAMSIQTIIDSWDTDKTQVFRMLNTLGTEMQKKYPERYTDDQKMRADKWTHRLDNQNVESEE